MAKKQNTAEIGFEDKIWKAADLLRGSIDAAEYNDFLGRQVGGVMDSIHQKEERKRDMDSEKGYQYDLIMRLKFIQNQLELMKQEVQ